jgi:hypothetical protein
MSKHGRKREKIRHDAHQHAKAHAEGHVEDPITRQHKGQYEEGERLGIRERIRRSSLTDWIIAVFTVVLAVAAIHQFRIMNDQLNTMRKDQRPWIKVAFDPAPIQALEPMGGTVHVVNNGKTPARSVSIEVLFEKVKNGEQPKLDYPKPYMKLDEGTLFPNDPQNAWVQRVRSAANKSVEADPLTQSEVEDFTKLSVFFVIYGTAHYSDFFGVDHWTKFCQPIVTANTSGTATFKPCTDYGDVDSN